MNIILAKTAGFCFGVNRAVNSVYESVKKYKMPVYTLGPIIHNKEVVGDLESKGVKVIERLEEVKDNRDGVVIIRSHGVPPEVYNNLKENEILSIDMTCPYVKKIHKIVKENHQKGYQVIIVGDPSHPEVIGINGWCENCGVIVNTIEDCYELPKFDKICIVVQTTFSREKWLDIRNFLVLNKCIEYVEFDTICSATNERQKEAVEISKAADVMIVIGGKHSSNTQKLYNISMQYCANSFQIETVKDLDLSKIRNFKNIGITAGASTPNWVIEEVIETLSGIGNEQNVSENEQKSDNFEPIGKEEYNNGESFAEALEKSLKPIKAGEIVSGEIIDINDEEVVVDLGYKSDGIIPLSELAEDVEGVLNSLKIGDKINVLVLRSDSREGNVILSKKEVDAKVGWEKVRKAYESKSVILVKIVKEVKGGVVGVYESLRFFVPFSQLSDKFVSDVEEFINTTIPARILELDEEKGNIVASSRVVLEESKQKAKTNFWESLHIGKDFIGKVKKLASYGAFVDIGGIDGLLHISEISWSKADSLEKYMNVDDEVAVYIKDIDKENHKISLGLKDKPENPWSKVAQKYAVGQVVEGTVVRFAPFGAFVELEEGIEGLVHISQISDRRILKPEEVLEVDEKVKAKITSIDPEKRRLGLSIKEIAPIDQRGESNLEINEKVTEHTEDFSFTIGDAIKIKRS